MDVRAIIISQFEAGLRMLRLAIESCPPEMWDDASHTNRFWRLAYHALFYTHLYLSPTEEEFAPWPNGTPGLHFLDEPLPASGAEPQRALYSPDDLLAYCQFVKARVAHD